jgi:hypothetical protein
MADRSRVNDVLGGFHEWGRPWEYIHAVLVHRGLESSDIQTINELWAEVTDAKYWLEPSFQTSDALIRQELERAYPWLSKGAVDSLIRGASYVWK